MAEAKTEFIENANKFRERLFEERTKKGYTQQSLADKLNASSWTFNAYEAKGSLPGFDMIIKLCKEFNVSADYLLGLAEKNFLSSFRLNYADLISEANFVDMVRVLNQRERLDFYIDKDKYGNACIGFKVYDERILEEFMGVLGLEACKQMIDEKHFGAAIDDIIKFSSKKRLINGKNLPDKPNWRDEHFTIDELKYYQETVHAYEEDW